MSAGLAAWAPGKINLCLFLGPVRGDGRHEVVTVLESVSLADRVTATLSTAGDEVSCPGVPEPNLVSLALAELRARQWSGPPLRIEIEKRIPVAGGMGGGSADAAAALRIAGELAPGPFAEIAAGLGADVPSQLAPGLALGTGAGEIVEPLAAVAPHGVALLPQPTPLSTAQVFREADRLGLPRSAADLREREDRLREGLACGGRMAWELVVNDLEPATTALCPPVAAALRDVRAAGAEQAIVCGSGPTVAGLFWGEAGAGLAEQAALELASRYPGARAAVPVAAEYGAPRPATGRGQPAAT